MPHTQPPRQLDTLGNPVWKHGVVPVTSAVGGPYGDPSTRPVNAIRSEIVPVETGEDQAKSDERLAEIQARADAAVIPELVWIVDPESTEIGTVRDAPATLDGISWPVCDVNMAVHGEARRAFIAGAHQDIPYLLRQVHRQRERIAALEAALRACSSYMFDSPFADGYGEHPVCKIADKVLAGARASAHGR